MAVLLILVPFQTAYANLFEDIFNDPEIVIRLALEVSEEFATKVAKAIGYEFSKSYFENLNEISASDLEFKRVLLSVIFSYDLINYHEILTKFPILQQFELEQQIQLVEDKKRELKEKFAIIGEYDSQAWNIVENNMERQLIAYYADETNVDELEKRRGLVDEATITAVQIFPTYDPDVGIVPLDYTAKKFVNKVPSLKGSDLSEDPVRATALIVLEPEFILHIDIIKTKDDHWISLEEASTYGYKTEDIEKAKLAIKTLDFISDSKDMTDPNQKISEFFEIVEGINAEAENLIPITSIQYHLT